MAAKTSFRGSFTALVTPFKNGSLDEAAFRALVSWQIAEGTHGLVPVGTTGESPTVSHDEHKRVVEWCIDEAKGRQCASSRKRCNAEQRLSRTAKSRSRDGNRRFVEPLVRPGPLLRAGRMFGYLAGLRPPLWKHAGWVRRVTG